MATITQVVLPTRTAGPLALWHLLSLDAPTVAALWTCFIARAAHVRIPISSPVEMFLAVWILYAADRLLDAAHSPATDLEARHLFHGRHWVGFLICIAVAATALAALLPNLHHGAIRLYLIEGVLLFVWFIILHATNSAHRLPKELAVGLFFSAATFIPTVARSPELRPESLPIAIVFAALCSLNCLFIYAWEHDGSAEMTAHTTTRLAIAHLQSLSVATAIVGGTLALLSASPSKPIAAACSLAALFLLSLHRNRRRLSRIDLRAAADVALLTPLLFLPFLR